MIENEILGKVKKYKVVCRDQKKEIFHVGCQQISRYSYLLTHLVLTECDSSQATGLRMSIPWWLLLETSLRSLLYNSVCSSLTWQQWKWIKCQHNGSYRLMLNLILEVTSHRFYPTIFDRKHRFTSHPKKGEYIKV
jgi:hypothetical protein